MVPTSPRLFVAKVAHVWGTAYDMGYAQGELLKDEMQEFIPDVYDYLVEQVLGKAANNTALAWAIKEGVEVALDLSYFRTKDAIKPCVSLCLRFVNTRLLLPGSQPS